MTEASLKDGTITIQVGERRFTTNSKTLTDGSGFFKALLAPNWQGGQAVQADGSYFVDADGDLFVHILQFLRRGVYPLFYSNSQGHDFAKYHALLGEARYFLVHKLVDWLEDRKYENTVVFHHSFSVHNGIEEKMRWATSSNIDVSYHPAWSTVYTYVCPRGMIGHRGDPILCEDECRRVQGNRRDKYSKEDVMNMVISEKRTELRLDYENELGFSQSTSNDDEPEHGTLRAPPNDENPELGPAQSSPPPTSGN